MRVQSPSPGSGSAPRSSFPGTAAGRRVTNYPLPITTWIDLSALYRRIIFGTQEEGEQTDRAKSAT